MISDSLIPNLYSVDELAKVDKEPVKDDVGEETESKMFPKGPLRRQPPCKAKDQ